MHLRSEVSRLTAENAALQRELDRYRTDTDYSDSRVSRALEELCADKCIKSSSDWIATYYVLTTAAKAPTSYAAFAQWINAIGLTSVPPCKADLLRKADPIFLKPLYRWEECTSVRASVLRSRLQIARRLKTLLS